VYWSHRTRQQILKPQATDQSPVLALSFVSPVSVVSLLLWLQSPVSAVAPVSSIGFVVRGSGSSTTSDSMICHSWHQYLLSFVAPLVVAFGSIGCRFWLRQLFVVAPVVSSPVVRGSSVISCRSWLHQYLSLVAPPVSSICQSLVAPVSSQYLLSFQWLQQAVAHGSSICRSWHQYHLSSRSSSLQYLPSLMAPVVSVSPVVRGSGFDRLWLRWLQYLLSFMALLYLSSHLHILWLLYLLSSLVAPPVAPVSVVCVSSTTICCLWLL